MKRTLQGLLATALILYGCAGARLSSEEARQKVAEIGGSEFVPGAVQIRRIVSQSEDEGIAESSVTLAFQFKRDAEGKWHVEAARLGDRNWVDIAELLAAVNEGRRRDTEASLQKVAAGIDGYRKTTGSIPNVRNIVGLTDILHPLYMTDLVREDGWGQPIDFEVTAGSAFRLVSKGPDGLRGTSDDIVVGSAGSADHPTSTDPSAP